MKGYVTSLVALALLLVPVAATGLASAAGGDRTQVIVEQGSTDRFGGGDWVRVSAGDATVAVLYGTTTNPNKIYVFAEYKRFLGGADIYDDQGNYLGTRGIPVYTVFGQSLDRLIEFQDDGDGLLNLHVLERVNGTTHDTPVKTLGFGTLAWTLSDLTNVNVSGTTYVNFTVSADDVPYEFVWGPGFLPRHATESDGNVTRLAFTFHLKVDVREITAEVPWWRVTVSEGVPRDITHVERLENRTLTGSAVAMGAKYDHLIDGWDFADRANKLALETTLIFGNYIPDRVVDFIHMAFFHGEIRNEDLRTNATVTRAERPTLITRDYIYVDDEWERIGRFVWVSDVVVDGIPARMYFQIQGGASGVWTHGGSVFAGFYLHGAFIYPAGGTIFHDPGLDATATSFAIGTVANLTPVTALAIQLAIAGLAVGPAIWLRARGRAKR